MLTDWIFRFFKIRKAEKLYNSKNYDQALDLFYEILKRFPNRIESHTNVGICLIQLNRITEGINHLENAIKVDQNEINSRNNLAHAYELNGEIDKAINQLDHLIEINPNEYWVYSKKAYLVGKSNINECISNYLQALDLKEDDSNLYCNLALAYHWNNEIELSKSTYQKSLNINPYNPTTLNNFGYLLSKIEEYQNALVYLNRCIDIKPDFACAINNRGYCYLRLKKYEKALNDFNKSIELDENNSYSFKNRALYFIDTNEKPNALKDLWKAKKLGFSEDYGEEVDRLIEELERPQQ